MRRARFPCCAKARIRKTRLVSATSHPSRASVTASAFPRRLLARKAQQRRPRIRRQRHRNMGGVNAEQSHHGRPFSLKLIATLAASFFSAIDRVWFSKLNPCGDGCLRRPALACPGTQGRSPALFDSISIFPTNRPTSRIKPSPLSRPGGQSIDSLSYSHSRHDSDRSFCYNFDSPAASGRARNPFQLSVTLAGTSRAVTELPASIAANHVQRLFAPAPA
jgi:hypothetical protein